MIDATAQKMKRIRRIESHFYIVSLIINSKGMDLFTLHKKRSFPLRISSVNVTADLVTSIEEILNGKRQFLCSVQGKNIFFL